MPPTKLLKKLNKLQTNLKIKNKLRAKFCVKLVFLELDTQQLFRQDPDQIRNDHHAEADCRHLTELFCKRLIFGDRDIKIEERNQDNNDNEHRDERREIHMDRKQKIRQNQDNDCQKVSPASIKT